MTTEKFVEENKKDLETLGLLFFLLLNLDFQTMSNEPSPTLLYVLQHEDSGTLGLKKTITQLIFEANTQGVPLVNTGFCESILRM